MVSYYNHFAMYPKNHSGNLSYSATTGWYPGNYQHQPPHPQFIGDGESSPQPMYYAHPHVFHPQSSPDWSGHENFSTPPQTTLLTHGPSPGGGGGGGGGGAGSGVGLHLGQAAANHLHHHHHHLHHSSGGSSNNNANGGNNHGHDHLADGLHSIPSPPITVSGSDMSSPGAPTGSASPQITPRPTPVKSPYEWMKKQSYQSQPNPGLLNICSAPSLQDFAPVEPGGKWKTRTKDKYRVVYTDQQRLELEKEFHYTRYITIRRKAELAQNLQLSERQVKIWFQNRRAKDRKQKKKAENGSIGGLGGPQSLVVGHSQAAQNHAAHSLLVDTKPKLEPSLHLSHLHQMSAMSMSMGSMGLHHPAHHPALHTHLGVPGSQHSHLNPQSAGAQVPVPTSLSIM
ncbi:homeotic protein caudal isoform X2 [Anopheles bellator]|uniref:homeotic protein caudal isoform X2 n=1 Tax=Anopheles bellator TaxID=139047 RepID=UPI0026498352|nr:homeotic protein caudal isoform X2 [Anopheles bellator]